VIGGGLLLLSNHNSIVYLTKVVVSHSLFLLQGFAERAKTVDGSLFGRRTIGLDHSSVVLSKQLGVFLLQRFCKTL
jgi:hypothetical protein